MLYYPWRDEGCDLLGNCTTYEEHYRNVKQVVDTNEAKYSVTPDYNVQYNEDGPPEHLWAGIAQLNFFICLSNSRGGYLSTQGTIGIWKNASLLEVFV